VASSLPRSLANTPPRRSGHATRPDGPDSQADSTTFFCLRRGLRLKDGPGSARAATVSAWLRQGFILLPSARGRVARTRRDRRRRALGRLGPGELSRTLGAAASYPAAYGLRSPPLFQPLTVLRGRGRIFPAPASRFRPSSPKTGQIGFTVVRCGRGVGHRQPH
jgi:hypothetical protein